MTPTLFVDGLEGTTGLKIHEYLAARTDIQLLTIDPDKRKDSAARKALLNAADVAILCLPDAASREAVALIDNPKTRVIDASTAFRTDPAWAYGLPELSPAQREKIRTAQRVANPGCHATAFLLAVAPLVAAGILSKDAQLTGFSITGYSGGGKKMIAAYEQNPAPKLRAPRHYALNLAHKHLPEMQTIAGLAYPPLFTPVVCDIYNGMAVEVFLPPTVFSRQLSPRQIHEALVAHYAGENFIRVMPLDAAPNLDDGYFDITTCNGTNRADIFLCANADSGQMVLICRLDNLGKGAAGAAIQCLNLMLHADESTGLRA